MHVTPAQPRLLRQPDIDVDLKGLVLIRRSQRDRIEPHLPRDGSLFCFARMVYKDGVRNHFNRGDGNLSENLEGNYIGYNILQHLKFRVCFCFHHFSINPFKMLVIVHE